MNPHYLVSILSVALFSSGCASPSKQSPVERSPYELDERGHLVVRSDLTSHLKSEKAASAKGAAALEGFGSLGFAPGASYAVRSPFAGYVERVHVQIGDRVEAGTVLATLRSSEVARLRADLRRLSASLESERDALARAERLVAENAASPREVVEAKSRTLALEAEAAGIRESLAAARTETSGADVVRLRAPQAGDVLARTVEPGERVEPSGDEPAFLVGNSTSLVVLANFPERDAALLAVGARCEFSLPALGTAHFEGIVSSVVRAIDPKTRTAKVICAPKSKDARLRSEMVAKISVTAGAEGTLVVPRSAVLLRRDERVVLVRRAPNVLERRLVTTGLNLGNDIQILSGLATDEEVVVEGAVLLDGEFDQLL